MFKNLTIRRKLTLFISVLLIVTVVSSILVANYVVSNTLKNQALENARNEMHTKVEYISTYLDALKNDVRVLSQSLTLQQLLEAQDRLKTDTTQVAAKDYERIKGILNQDLK
jgi:peptidoglycan hydrolase CwlO-like protein